MNFNKSIFFTIIISLFCTTAQPIEFKLFTDEQIQKLVDAITNSKDSLRYLGEKLSLLKDISIIVPPLKISTPSIKTVSIAASGTLLCATGAYLLTHSASDTTNQPESEISNSDKKYSAKEKKSRTKNLSITQKAIACFATGLALILLSDKIAKMIR